MGFIHNACRPLSLDEFCWLLSTNERSPFPSETYSWKHLETCCHGLIETDRLKNVVFVHRSIAHCLTTNNLFCSPGTHHNELAKRCLYHLTDGPIQDGVCSDLLALGKRLNQSPLLDYAARHWSDHFQKSSGPKYHPESDPSGSISAILYKRAKSFLQQDNRVEAAFQVTLFTRRNHQAHLNQMLKPGSIDRVSLQVVETQEKNLLDPFKPNNMTGLHVACQNGFRTLAEEFITKNLYRPNVLDKKNVHGYTALHYAVIGSHDHIVGKLLKAESNINCGDLSEAGTPLILATARGDSGMAQLLLQQGGTSLKVNAMTHHDYHFRAHEFEFLMQEGIGELQSVVNVLSSVSGRTALHYAARNGLLEVVKELCKKDALKMDIKDSEGQIAWHKAAKYGHTDILREFFRLGVDPLCKIGDSEPSNNDEPNQKRLEFDGYQNTALHLAAKYGRQEAVEYLLKLRPKIVGVRNHRGMTALSLATMYNQPEMVALLLHQSSDEQRNAVIDSEDEAMLRPIHYAALDKSGESMDALLYHAGLIQLDARSDQRMAPIEFAARIGQRVHIEKLLEHKVKTSRRDGQKFSALDHALDAKNWQTFRALWMHDHGEAKRALKLDEIDSMLKVLENSNPPADIRDLLKEEYVHKLSMKHTC